MSSFRALEFAIGLGISQTLTGVGLQPNATYTLKVAVGHRLDDYPNTYTIALQAGATVLASVSGNNSTITKGTFQDQVVSYTTGSTVTSGDLAIVLTSGGIQIDFDYVRLSVNSTYYYFGDQVGTTRTITDASGKLCYDADFTPYGQEMSHTERLQTTACPPNYRFTGYEYDPETTNYYAFARYYSPRLGRFLSTDPLGGAIGDLQSHNAYAYTVNNPVNLVDPAGLSGCPNNPNIPPGTNCGPPPNVPYGGICGGGPCDPVNGYIGLGGDFSCSIDGAPASCGMALGLLQGDAAFIPGFLGETIDSEIKSIVGSALMDLFVGQFNGDGGNTSGGGTRALKLYLKATSDCLGGFGREIQYDLRSVAPNGTESVAKGYIVTEHLVPRSPGESVNLLTGSTTSQPPNQFGLSGFQDSIGGLGRQDNLQTFTVSPVSGGPSTNVFVRDINGNDFGTNGIYVQKGQVYVNGTLATKPCGQ